MIGYPKNLKDNVKATFKSGHCYWSDKKFARKQHEKILSYHFLEILNEVEGTNTKKKYLEHLTKMFNNHQYDLDSYYRFIINSWIKYIWSWIAHILSLVV